MAYPPELLTAAEGAAYAAVYAALWYARRRQHENEDFDPAKFGATVVLGAALGVAMALAGDPLSQADIEAKLVVYAGLLTVLTPIIRMVLDGLRSLEVVKLATGGDPPDPDDGGD